MTWYMLACSLHIYLSILTHQVGMIPRFLVDTAHTEGRVILTCDRGFVSRRLSNQTFYVQGKDKKAQLAEVIAAFDLQISNSNLLSRCAKCNGKFIPRYNSHFLLGFLPFKVRRLNLLSFSPNLQAADSVGVALKSDCRLRPIAALGNCRPFKIAELPPQAFKQVESNTSMLTGNTDFWVCAQCSHVYWRGSQFERCIQHLTQRLRH